MIIIVDAYNLLHAISSSKGAITDRERAQFIALLGSYGKAKNHKMVIVFDGGPYEWPFKENTKRVSIVYSGIHESADDYIKKYLQEHREKDLLLVSSDRELNRCADRMEIASIDSLSFYGLMRQERTEKQMIVCDDHVQKTVKTSQDTTAIDIDALMIAASKNVPIKSDDFVHTKKRTEKTQRSGKDERALLKKLNKL